jgi:hypothetical protein
MATNSPLCPFPDVNGQRAIRVALRVLVIAPKNVAINGIDDWVTGLGVPHSGEQVVSEGNADRQVA